LSASNRSKGSKGPLIWPLALAVVGGLLLLSNFLLLGDFDLLNLSPLLLVILGAVILLRGDLRPAEDARTFGITRGSLEAATLEINASDIDVNISPLPQANSERLIEGQYAHQSRPSLDVSSDTHAHLLMTRSQTPWLTFADWDVALSRELPWQVLVSSAIGQVTADLSDVIVQNALISAGFADIHVSAPYEAFEAIYLHSVLGSVTVVAPPRGRVRVTIEGGRFFGVHVDTSRYQMIEDDVYITRAADADAPLVDIIVNGTFGDTYLT
jgi:hypothetical protein